MLLAQQELSPSDMRLLSYCLMDTHFHFLILAGARLSLRMQRLLSRYAQYFNETYGRVGHLFQDRFSVTPVRTLDHALNAVAYIHLNPVEASMVLTVADWPWSSHAELLSGRGPFLAFDSFEDAFGLSREEVVEHYLHRVALASQDDDVTLSDIISRAATRAGLDPVSFSQKGRDQHFMAAKRRLIIRARERGFSLHEIANRLACSPAAVCKLAI